ncbi:hypothetical protein FLJC2902T_04030 [Flavobacterium limnosediminis JC2902]|uniref:Lipoprotein n=1 Tax=Flavobacterium limnosediminis JC2902 TaxID=1341181 RepID=V6SUR2_9FLAO|nr:hypothetical protein [Flavobacterium limnosediminis]ESU29922.1 hypothetical protein FLJC2902T_04030 [Flavobacterium limnosediminis JC2902]
MKTTVKGLRFLFFFFFLLGCSDQDDAIVNHDPVCDVGNTTFQQMYSSLAVASSSHELVTMDSEIHEYSFTLSSSKTICSIGYQSVHSDPAIPYIIEIENNDTNIVLYSGTHIFSQTATSYVAPTSTISLLPNVSYSIRRIQTNWDGDAYNVCGRLIESYDNLNTISVLPISLNGMTVTGSKFSDVSDATNGPGDIDFILPYIDIVFEN